VPSSASYAKVRVTIVLADDGRRQRKPVLPGNEDLRNMNKIQKSHLKTEEPSKNKVIAFSST
jgi:hypothetical protein